MATIMKLPKGAMGIAEATITKWHKAEGETVTQGEILVGVETAKAALEVEAPCGGVLTKILVPEDETVEVLSDIAVIEES